MAILTDTLISGNLNVTGNFSSANQTLLESASSANSTMLSSGYFSYITSNVTVNKMYLYKNGNLIYMRGEIQYSSAISSSLDIINTTIYPIQEVICPIFLTGETYYPLTTASMKIRTDGTLNIKTSTSIAANTKLNFSILYMAK